MAFQSTPPVWGATVNAVTARNAKLFQSTPPVWGATIWSHTHGGHSGISIHAPRVGGDQPDLVPCSIRFISIHAPRVGGDSSRSAIASWIAAYFNPRPPCGGRRGRPGGENGNGHFNPRPPCGGRPLLCHWMDISHKVFQSTPPVWGATPSFCGPRCLEQISIHAPRVGGDLWQLHAQYGFGISIHAPRVGGD